MHDAVAVAEVQCRADVRDHLHRATRRHRALAADDVPQGDAVDVLHHDVRQRATVGFGFTGVVDGDDRRVVERRRVLRLAAETQVERGVAGQVGSQHLDRDVAAQAQVTSQVNLGHATEAENLTQLVAGGEFAGCGHGCPWLAVVVVALVVVVVVVVGGGVSVTANLSVLVVGTVVVVTGL